MKAAILFLRGGKLMPNESSLKRSTEIVDKLLLDLAISISEFEKENLLPPLEGERKLTVREALKTIGNVLLTMLTEEQEEASSVVQQEHRNPEQFKRHQESVGADRHSVQSHHPCLGRGKRQG